MPIYEYRCDECGTRFEAWLRSMQSPPPDSCPKCGAPTIKRTPSLFAGTAKPAGSGADLGSCGSTGST